MRPDKQDDSREPTGATSGDHWGEASPRLEAALDQLSARLERLRRQAENLAASLKPKRG